MSTGLCVNDNEMLDPLSSIMCPCLSISRKICKDSEPTPIQSHVQQKQIFKVVAVVMPKIGWAHGAVHLLLI